MSSHGDPRSRARQPSSFAAGPTKFARMYKNPFVNVAMTFLERLPVEILVSLISAGLLSRKRRRDEAEAAPA